MAKSTEGKRKRPKVAVIPARDVRIGDVVELRGHVGVIKRRWVRSEFPDVINFDWFAEGEEDTFRIRIAVRRFDEDVTLLRRPGPKEVTDDDPALD